MNNLTKEEVIELVKQNSDCVLMLSTLDKTDKDGYIIVKESEEVFIRMVKSVMNLKFNLQII